MVEAVRNMNGRASVGSAPQTYILHRTLGGTAEAAPSDAANHTGERPGKRMRQMTAKRTGFLRHFISGFALGAVALVAVQVADRSDAKSVRAAPAVVERIG